jgi:pyrimidine operon attenuation protein / uracil phosphoribosyltransferase
MVLKAQIMDERAMQRALTRIGHEIVERNKGTDNLVLIGVRRRGVPLAEQLSRLIAGIDGCAPIPVGVLDIAFYRDDLSVRAEQPEVLGNSLPFKLEGKTVVLVDDVIYTGRTIRAALDALMDLGRAQRIQLAVLIDRGHRELPIRPDFVGKNVPTSSEEVIAVKVDEFDGENSVTLYQQD